MAAALDAFSELVRAVTTNDVAAARQALDRHPELKARLNDGVNDHFGATPLILAVGRCNRELVDVLLDAGADINARSHWWAGSFGVLDDDKGLAPHLIARGAIVTAHAAARLGMIDRLRDLVTADPSVVHARGGDGQTPLHFAKTIEIADFLLLHGADIDARDVDHESTPAQWMLDGRLDVARHLVSKGAHTDILMAAAIGDLTLVKRHLSADPKTATMNVSMRWFPKVDPRSGGTIYIWTLGWHKCAETVARKFGHREIEQYMRDVTAGEHDPMRVIAAAIDDDVAELRDLLDRGWPVDAADENGTTALHWAGFHGSLPLATELIARHAPLGVFESTYGRTPVAWCIHGSMNGWHRNRGDYGGVIRAMLRAGAPLPPNAATVPMSDAVRSAINEAH